MKNIAIIPARGGSKRIPRKNIKKFIDRPIIAYSIESALSSGVFDTVMVSTDDYEIAEIAKSVGASVPFFRSAMMSSDTAMTVPVLIEVLQQYEKKADFYDNVCCLYPCAPFVTSERLREGVLLLNSTGADSVIPIVKYSHPPQRGLVIRNECVNMIMPENCDIRSQDFESIYHDAGQFYWLKTSALIAQQSLFCKKTVPIILEEHEVQDIDTISDWMYAELKYKILGLK